jgi:hypoxanthine phosphoribosyltransferase
MTDREPAVQTEPLVRTLFTAEQIAVRVREMGLELARDYSGERPVYVGVLKGACVFQCDLARATPLDVELDFVSVASYQGTVSSGSARLIADLRHSVSGRHVVLCEGVVDSGLTVDFILKVIRGHNPASVRVATLLDKAACRKIDVPVDYTGWRIGSEFVVGYGLDASERYRNLPYVGILEEA